MSRYYTITNLKLLQKMNQQEIIDFSIKKELILLNDSEIVQNKIDEI